MRAFITGFCVAMAWAGAASAAALLYEATFVEDLSATPSAEATTSYTPITSDGATLHGPYLDEFARVEAKAVVDPEIPFTTDVAEATATLFFTLTNVSPDILTFDIDLFFFPSLESQEFDANASYEISYGEFFDSPMLSGGQTIGQGTGDTVFSANFFLPLEELTLAPGESASRFVEVYARAAAAQAEDVINEARATSDVIIFPSNLQISPATVIPLPAGLPLLLTALGGICALTRGRT